MAKERRKSEFKLEIEGKLEIMQKPKEGILGQPCKGVKMHFKNFKER